MQSPYMYDLSTSLVHGVGFSYTFHEHQSLHFNLRVNAVVTFD